MRVYVALPGTLLVLEHVQQLPEERRKEELVRKKNKEERRTTLVRDSRLEFLCKRGADVKQDLEGAIHSRVTPHPSCEADLKLVDPVDGPVAYEGVDQSEGEVRKLGL